MPDHRSIQELAYLLWEARGRPHGSAEHDWLTAERQVGAHSTPAASAPTAAQPTAKSVDDALKDSFPASDPPAAHRPDEPPVNADQKWRAAGRTRTTGRPKAAKATTPTSSAAKPPMPPLSAATDHSLSQPVATRKPGTRATPKPKEANAKSATGKKPSSSAPKSP